MNAMVQMPDHGELQAEDFNGPDYIFSGHFHKRQTNNKVVYIGNAFPHNFSDAWDDDRGMMFMDWGGEPQYRAWPDAPKFRTLKLSKLIDEKDTIMKSKMYLKVNLDIDISYEEANFIKESFINDHDIREISLIQEKNNIESTTDDTPETNFESVDQIVTEQLVNIDSETIDKLKLLEIYRSL
jgi:DNA repair exonuclease SbcCD nuclease subunit